MLDGRRPAIDERVVLNFLTAPTAGPFDDPGGVIPARWRQKSPDERRDLFATLLAGFLDPDRSPSNALLVVAEPGLAALVFFGILRLVPSLALLDTLVRRGYDTVDRANRTGAGQMQTKTVDPYYEWLGIPPKDQPPNHYRLLGLELFEENRNVIDAAANRQMSFIKEYQAGADSALSQKLLNQLSAARICLLSPATKAAYEEQLRAKLQAQMAPVSAEPASADSRWRNESAAPAAPPVGLPLARPSASPTASTAVPGAEATPVPLGMEPPPLVVSGGLSGILRQSKTGLGALAVAAGVLAAALALVLAFVVARSLGPAPPFPDDAVAQGPGPQPADTDEPEASIAEPVPASDPDASSPPPLRPSPTPSADSVGSQPPPSGTAVPVVPEATQPLPLPPPALVLEPATPVPGPPEQAVPPPVMELPAEQPALVAEPPPLPVETLEQAEERLKIDAEQASTPAEHEAVAQELLEIADQAIVDSQIDLAKRVAERALAAARKSESYDLDKQATLLWSELQQPLTEEVKERVRQRIRGRKP